MRSLTFAAAMLVVGLAAVSVDAGGKIPNHLSHKQHVVKATQSLQRFVKLHKAGYFLMSKKAKANFDLNTLDTHKFNPQQDFSDFASASQGCQAAFATWYSTHGTCLTGGTNPLEGVFGGGWKSSTEAAAEWEAFRTSACYPAWTSDYRVFVEACRADFGNKAANEALILPTLIDHFSSATGTDGTKCGVSFNHATNFGACGRVNNTLCAGKLSETCQVVDKKEYDLVEEDQYSFRYEAGGTSAPRNITCESKWADEAALAGMCNGCLGGFARKFRDLDKDNTFVEQFLVFERLLCSKSTTSGNFCLNDLASVGTSNMLSESQVDGICADKGQLGCYLGILTAGTAQNKKTALATFKTCAFGYDTANPRNITADQLVSGGRYEYCLSTYKGYIEQIKESQIMSKYLCMANKAGNNCVVARQNLFTSTEGCYRAAQQHSRWLTASSWRREWYGLYNCSNCSTVLQTAVDNMGCCAGLIQEATTQVVTFGPNDWPTLPGLPSAAEANVTGLESQNCTVPTTIPDGSEATTMSGPGFIKNTAQCGVTGLDTSLCTKCAKSQKTVKKELKLKISWAKLQDDLALKEKVKLGLRTDMADNLGISIEDIINDEIAEDTSVTVTITTTTTTTRRQQATTTETKATGTKYTFEFGGQTDDQVEAASANYDNLQSSGTLEIESTEAATSDCGCVGDGSLAATQTTESGAGAATAFISAVVAVLCLLF